MNDKTNNFKTAVSELLGTKGPQPVQPASGYPQERPLQAAVTPAASSVILKDMTVQGSVYSASNIEIQGKVQGNVKSGGKILSSGMIEGNIEACTVYIRHGAVKGNVSAKGELVIEDDSVVVGDIHAASAQLNGRVKGNIRVDEQVTIHSRTVVLGDINARAASLEEGARISGKVDIAEERVTEDLFNMEVLEERPVPKPQEDWEGKE